MRLAKILRLIIQNIRRNSGHFSMSAIGIIIGIASLSFFVALRNGVKVWIHSEDILPLNKIEIVPKKSNLNDQRPKDTLFEPLNDAAVQKMRARPEVVAAYPKMKFAFPGLARGGQSLFGQDIQIEFIGDGIDPKLVADEKITKPLGFRDYWGTENPRKDCKVDAECPQGSICNQYSHSCSECRLDGDCAAGHYCEPRIKMCLPLYKCWPKDPFTRKQDGTYLTDKTGKRQRKRTKHEDCWAVSNRFRCDFQTQRCTNHCLSDAQCGKFYYCDKEATQTCYRAVPALVSRYIIEMYNGNIAPGRNWPKINDFVASQFFGMVFTAAIGDSVMGAGRKNVRVRKIQLVGISRKAINLGVTVPIGYVKRWNRAFALRDGSTKRILPSEEFKYKTYSSVVIWVRSKSDVSRFTHFVQTLGFTQQDSAAEMVGQFIDFVGLDRKSVV